MEINKLPAVLQKKIEKRHQENSFRFLTSTYDGIDFFSNDYLGFAQNKMIHQNVLEAVKKNELMNGSTGSRLISGTSELHLEVEEMLANYHNTDAALLFNSGYDANVGLFSSILQKNDVLLFDELIHASVRDGIRLSNANTYKFKHNNLVDLESKLKKFENSSETLYVAVETVYSMDGDTAPLNSIVSLCKKYNAFLIVDEAHSGGVFDKFGQGLITALGLENDVFARVHTFGKALGCHGAVVLGSNHLRDYLINFSRSFIYTTAISTHAVLFIKYAYRQLLDGDVSKLHKLIYFFNQQIDLLGLRNVFIESSSAIHCCLLKGNDRVKQLESCLKEKGFLVKAVLYPTVPKNKERIRICLHTYNTKDQISELLLVINHFFQNK